MKKSSFIATILIASLLATPIQVVAASFDDYDQEISNDLENKATMSDAFPSPEIVQDDQETESKDLIEDKDSESVEEEEKIPEVEEEKEIEIKEVDLSVSYKAPLNEENISLVINTEHCTLNSLSITNYNAATIKLYSDDGYRFFLKDREKSVSIHGNGVKATLIGPTTSDTRRITISIIFDISAEALPDDDIQAEFGKAVERFGCVMDEIYTNGVRMSDANTREELYSLIISKLENAATENIEFELEILDNDKNGPGSFRPAIAGTKNNRNGVNGIFGVRVYLWPKGDKTKNKLLNNSIIIIYATQYNNIWDSDNGYEKNKSYDNEKTDTISFYKNGKLMSVPCIIHYDNYRYGNYTTVKYNSIEIEKFNGKSPNLIYNYTVIDNGGYSSTSTSVFIYVNGERKERIGCTNASNWLKLTQNQLSIPIPSNLFNEGDRVEIYIDGFGAQNSNTGNSGSSGSGSGSSGGSGGGGGGSSSGGGGGSSSGSGGVVSSGMLITKPIITAGTWEQEEDNWKLKLEDGSYASSQWALLDSKWYIFDGKYTMLTGWNKVNGKWYFMGADGVMLTGWQMISGKWYWLEPSGEMATGWKWVEEKCYYLDESGAMATNTTTPDGYYVDAEGVWDGKDRNGQ